MLRHVTKQVGTVNSLLIPYQSRDAVCVRMAALRQKRPFTENGAGRSWSANGHASRSGLRDELSFTSLRHGGLTEGADSELSDADLCADEFHPVVSHSGAKGGRTKRWSFGRAAIAARSSSSS